MLSTEFILVRLFFVNDSASQFQLMDPGTISSFHWFELLLIAKTFKRYFFQVFSLASPCFLMITLCGCAIMYMEVSKTMPIRTNFNLIAPEKNTEVVLLVP